MGLTWGLRRVHSYIVTADQAEGPTYRVDLGLTTETVAWALVLAVASAVIVSVLPALEVTGRTIQANIQRAVVERLEAEPWVRGVAVASELPRTGHESARVEVEGEPTFDDLDFRSTLDRWPAVVRADIGFLEGLDQRILAGRGFDEADLDGAPSVAIVNTRFVERALEGRNALGRRIRFPDREPEGEPHWLEIVGVVNRLGTNVGLPEYDAAVYLPTSPGDLYPLRLAVHVAGDPAAAASRVRELVAEVEPAAVVVPPVPLSEVFPGNYLLFLLTSSGVTLLVLVLVALAISGIYTILSFAVSERTREIAIRTALGAKRVSVVGTVARRSLWQIGVGAVVGMPMAGWLFQLAESGTDSGRASFGVALGAGIGIVVLVAVVSGAAPTRRALRIQPQEALREEG